MQKELILEAKNALDNVIKKSRIHLYKPIQIAEILHRHRIFKDIELGNLDTYRTKSKKWRDKVCIALLGRVSTSSAKYQDDLFNAISPQLIEALGWINNKNNGAVEAYIYKQFLDKYFELKLALDYCLKNNKDDFKLAEFLGIFWSKPGLKRSLDKIYEIITYALFDTLTQSLELEISVTINKNKLEILNEFEEFTNAVLNLNLKQNNFTQKAKIYRVGVTNAADRGLDAYANFGVAIQIKHLTLDLELAQNIVTNIMADKIVIVCKDAEKQVISTLLGQVGFASRIQSIIVESDLIRWYEIALRGNHSNILGDKLLKALRNEIAIEFPSVAELPEILKAREYEKINIDFSV